MSRQDSRYSYSLRDDADSQDLSGLRSEGREPGARRRKLAGYLKAANELRQSYQQSYTPSWRARDGPDGRYGELHEGSPGAYPDGAATAQRGDEELVLFPSYARRHIKSKPMAEPGTIQENSGEGRDVRDAPGAGDAEYWKDQWQKYEDDNAIVDVDVRGWLFAPFSGQMNRKQRLFVGLARQMVGLSAPPTSQGQSAANSGASSRNTSPGPPNSQKERLNSRAARQDEELVSREAENLLRRGEEEAEYAGKGQYSEPLNSDIHRREARSSVPSAQHHDDPDIRPIEKRTSWNQPADMSPSELVEANKHLMARLMPFMANPLGNLPISVFFYNDSESQQRTVHTNPAGHFGMRAALEFVPTHVRVLAAENLSVTEEVVVTEADGVSLISDIDDTIKHSAIGSGAREIFRNAFIRDLADLTIDGVREWYSRLAEMGVKFHYVSNSPWQLYPVLTKFFSMAGLPPGSFHLKQYSGMLQGIFEPVAERKKGTLDRIAIDFPQRRFILVGDSGEADLEVYTDFVLENPDRVLAVFIRDVTTSPATGFFDSSMGPLAGNQNLHSENNRKSSESNVKTFAFSHEDDDPDLKAAIAASLRDMEDDPRHRPSLPTRRPTEPPAPEASSMDSPFGDLIDLSDDNHHVAPRRQNSFPLTSQNSHDLALLVNKPRPPAPPMKPSTLRSFSASSPDNAPSSAMQQSGSVDTNVGTKSPPPPKPRRPSSSISSLPSSASLQQSQQPPKPQPPPKPSQQQIQQGQQHQGHAASARQKLTSAYNNLPSMHSSSAPYGPQNGSESSSLVTTTFSSTAPNDIAHKPAPPPPPPMRRGITAYPAAAANFATTRISNAWSAMPAYRAGSPGPQGPGAAPSGAANFSSNGSGGEDVVNKKELLWRQRWERARGILEAKGVMLMRWRVGTDVLGEAVKLVEKAQEEMQNEVNRKGVDKKR